MVFGFFLFVCFLRLCSKVTGSLLKNKQVGKCKRLPKIHPELLKFFTVVLL